MYIQYVGFKYHVHAVFKVSTWDTRSAFTSTDKVETGGVYDTGLASPCEIPVECHLEEHEGRVNAVVVELEHIAQSGEPFLS